MPNDITELRTHLFDTLKALKDKDNPMDLERAKTIADVGRVLVDSAKAEVAFLNATGEALSTGFMPAAPRTPARPQLASNAK